MMQKPILYLIFNRPDLMEQSFPAIREAQPEQLFIAADGPRRGKDGDEKRCEAARRIIERVDWRCEVKTLFRDKNIGCRKAVSEAVTWFFKHVDEGIILEDDCVVDASFFLFCEQLLQRYRADSRIMVISGDNHQQGVSRTDASYYFSKYPHCWGWATWRRAWALYDDEMVGWQKTFASPAFQKLFYSRYEREYWHRQFSSRNEGRVDSWAIAWVYACWKNCGLSALPEVNLVKNIGWGDDATHTDYCLTKYVQTTDSLSFPLRHPDKIEINKKADIRTDKRIFSKRLINIRNRIMTCRWKYSAMVRGKLHELYKKLG